MRKLLVLAAIALCVLPIGAQADWLHSQQGPVPVCVGFSFGATIANSEQHTFNVPTLFSVPANTGSALGFASGCNFVTAATGDSAFLIQDCSTSGSCTTKATFTVSASGHTCGFSTQGAFTVAQGHLLAVTGPSSADATLANGSVTVCGTR